MDQAYCDALRFAYEYEQKGEKHYREAAQQAKDRFARQALTFLADEEVEHIRKISAFNDSLIGAGTFDLDLECKLALPDRVKEFLDSSRQTGHISDEREWSDSEVYDVAMGNEKQGFEMYAKVEEGTQDPKLKQFFAFLAAEEKVHYGLLVASKKYLEEPSYYFEEGGGWLFG